MEIQLALKNMEKITSIRAEQSMDFHILNSNQIISALHPSLC